MTGYLPEAEYQTVFSKVPRLCIDLLIEKEGKVLLTKREVAPAVGKWHIPGGRVMFRETLMQAAERIALRELGVKLVPQKLLGYLELTEEDTGLHSVSLVFLCHLIKRDFLEVKGEMEFVERIPDEIIPEHANFLRTILHLEG